MQELSIKVKRLTETAILPEKNHNDDSCWDLFADTLEARGYKFSSTQGYDLIPAYFLQSIATKLSEWHSAEVLKIHTGIAIELPKGYGAVIKPRSGLGSQGIHVLCGEMDNGYRGEWIVCLINLSKGAVSFDPGDKIAQFRLVKIPQFVSIEEVDELGVAERGEKGFGSSG